MKLWERGRASRDGYLVQSFALCLYGFATMRNPAGWLDKQVYDFLDNVPKDQLWKVSSLIVAIGVIMAVAFVTKLTIFRVVGSLSALTIWSAFAWGGLHHDADAYVSYMYASASFSALVALYRA